MPIIFWLADDFLNLVINERSSFEAPLKEHKTNQTHETLPGSSNR